MANVRPGRSGHGVTVRPGRSGHAILKKCSPAFGLREEKVRRCVRRDANTKVVVLVVCDEGSGGEGGGVR